MSYYGKAALGIDGIDYPKIKKDIQTLKPDKIRTVNTPDNTYLLFYWDYVDWSGEKVDALMEHVDNIRHSFIRISEEGEVVQDNKVLDNNGCDEEFWELLAPHGEICVWGDESDVLGLSVQESRLLAILQDIIGEEVSRSGYDSARKLLNHVGVSVAEAKDLGLDYLFPHVMKGDHPDWLITMEELNRVLSFVDYHAEIDENGLISIEDDQGYDDTEGGYFLTPQEVIQFFDGSCVFEDNFLNGEICCSHPGEFKNYEEARKTASETGYETEAELLDIIIKALNPFR